MKRKLDDLFTPGSKKPNIVSHILQARDQNIPAVIKTEPTCDKNASKPVIKKENDDDCVLKSEPTKKSCVHPSFELTLVLQSLGKNKFLHC